MAVPIPDISGCPNDFTPETIKLGCPPTASDPPAAATNPPAAGDKSENETPPLKPAPEDYKAFQRPEDEYVDPIEEVFFK